MSVAVPSNPCVDETKLTVPVGEEPVVLVGTTVAVRVTTLPVFTVVLEAEILVVVAMVAVLA